MDGFVLPDKLLSTLSNAAGTARSHDFIHVYSHYDADGLTAAAIVCKALMRAGKEFQVTTFHTLTDPQMQIIEENRDACVLMTDLGASYIDRLEKLGGDVIVLDHHTLGVTNTEKVIYANPHLYGIDGMTSGCGATMAFLFAITLDDRNWDLAPVAMAGIAGDRQHLNGVSGLNIYLLEGAKKRELIEEMPGSLIPFGDLATELYVSTEPYIAGITGDADAVTAFLKEARTAPGKSFTDLAPEEKVRLSSMIAVKLAQQGVTRDKLEETARTRYYLPTWNTDAESLSGWINSSGRSDEQGIGILAGMGDRNALQRAKEIDAESRKNFLAGIKSAMEGKLHQMENIQWFDSSSSGFTGMICGVIMSFIGDPDKPTIGINCSEEDANISSRGTFPLLDKGVDLADAMKRGCASVGGEGGGHRIAAGGSIKSAKRDEFLANVDKIVGEQKVSHAM
ncbi:Single-stranded DNA-specific exonuclease [Thermoplasmatales archaeon BRNA1]|nr:Single-stranded DNA-specific exonuclease [Thermoplasmatales archaeon BRNA1]